MSILKELQWRGLIKQITNEERLLKAEKNHSAVYCGFDPTADSLHVGHLMMIIMLKRFSDFGFKAIALVGGGTGMIGDPSFKSDERQLQTNEQLLKNFNSIEKQLKSIIKGVEFKNNKDWLGKFSMIDFLREVGKDFNISYLLNKESIATRISTGLSFTEFSYTMLQAYDFYHLYINDDCKVQLGGSDQWGNLTSGTDYISSKVGSDKTEAVGVTIPLLLKADGTKFGKTSSGAIWLDENKTSVYNFYQFWLNQTDEDSQNFIKFLTFYNENEIKKLIETHKNEPKNRHVQKALAESLTNFVHGQEKLDQAKLLTEGFFKGNIFDLDKNLIELAIKSMNSIEVKKNESLADSLIKVKAVQSKRELREFIASKAISYNNVVLVKEDLLIADINPIFENKIIIKKGKKSYFVLTII
ncbi:tyrosyl-tRNA synthetase [Entomoplasma ellychniae]|uniref:Tyrosine--tRNA ligase n=1 Tax=Entomoplasma ellychniae TaxID=2114 RepID=A0A8E2UAN6_9MOLU|nr:tyrosine--tRNA ligase [Entomoplasma ellychniae]PPE04711.1 tyrosyl-tRNA synthetase [Entomoplasma ellychniae]